MSRPTPREELYRWHSNAMLGVLGDDPPITDDPQCGWFQRPLVKGGVMVPARIWMHQPVDEETGDLVGDETLQCEVDGRYADPNAQWTWLAGAPISEAEFNYLTAKRQWSEDYAPHEPYANPRQPVDWLAVPTPSFTKEPTP
jgi:hypothetical protein